MKQQFPILEYDPAHEAILEPKQMLSPIDIAENCVLCFFQDVISTLNESGQLRQVYELGSEIGVNPVYEMKTEGCLTVEMETAAFCAVAQFRGVVVVQILYGGDDLSGDEWDRRDWQKLGSTREKLFWLAAEACLQL